MKNSQTLLKEQALKELAIRELESRHIKQRESLVSFIEYFFENELNKPFDNNWHYLVIEEKLKQVLEGKITRLIINIPPGSGKTELITKCFPVWALGNRPDLHIIATGYSTQLTQTFGTQARDYYLSDTFQKVFPRRPKLRDDQNAKGLWVNEQGGRYLATGAGGSIIGNRANIFLIDDPIKPDEAQSDVKREAINRWYDNTVVSRLFNPLTDAIIIIMQRTHESDLCGYLEDREKVGGEAWDRLVLPAIAVEDEDHRAMGEPLQENRYPIKALESLRQALGESNFSGQYQQDPVNKEAQYFHEEFFKYYEEVPSGMRIFTLVDPAFKVKKENDYTSIMTIGFKGDELYVLEYSQVKLHAAEVIDKIIYHLLKWKSEKVGVEAYAAQTVLAQWLKEKMKTNNVNVPMEEITQTGDKGFKIRQLDTPIRTGKIYWRREMFELETQLKKFPRGKNDDIVDTLQMAYSVYFPKYAKQEGIEIPKIQYDSMGRIIYA